MNPIAKNVLMNRLRALHETTLGRPRTLRLDVVVDRINYLLRTGCQWSCLPVPNGSWKTVYHYFSLWSKSNIFEYAFQDLLKFYMKVRHRPLGRVVVDTSFVKNVLGRDCVGRSPVDRGRKATKVNALVDEDGLPLQLLFHPGNKNDGKSLFHLLHKASRIVPLRKLQIYGDKAYDSERCRENIREHQMVNRFSKRKRAPIRSENLKRLVVEHFFGWMDKYRRIIMRYDGLVCHFRSFHYLASIHLVANRLITDCP